jgi:uncharacterized DUF497 family protein
MVSSNDFQKAVEPKINLTGVYNYEKIFRVISASNMNRRERKFYEENQ